MTLLLNRFDLPIAAFFLFTATHTFGQSERTPLVEQQHCMFCHTEDEPVLGPSFKEIAERYRNVPNAEAMLEHKLRMGGRAHWGNLTMPSPDERGGPLSAEDAHTLVQWVLSHYD